MNHSKNLTDFQYDALKEVGNIGIGQATTSLSRMVNKQVNISLPDLKLIPLLEIPEMLSQDLPVVTILLELRDEARGYLMLLLSLDSAKMLVKMMLGEVKEGDAFDEMEQSVLMELGNILTGTYISALSNLLDISMGLSTPVQVYDFAGAIVNQIVILMSQDVDDVLLLNTEFSVDDTRIDGKILVFTDSLSLTKILESVNRLAGI
ncbi:MAG: chemotaxis protein CheC [Candidatus Methanoperedenaceae archaeon]|nr:chemotaxis protein CheC [Candidatus Methanoperedenaceae archaeon]